MVIQLELKLSWNNPLASEVTRPDSKVHGANMGPIWGRHDPGGPHFVPKNFAIWDVLYRETGHMDLLAGNITTSML